MIEKPAHDIISTTGYKTFSLYVLVASVFVFMLPFVLIWGIDAFKAGGYYFLFNLYVTFPVLVVGIAMHELLHVGMPACMHALMHACMHLGKQACLHACMHACISA